MNQPARRYASRDILSQWARKNTRSSNRSRSLRVMWPWRQVRVTSVWRLRELASRKTLQLVTVSHESWRSVRTIITEVFANYVPWIASISSAIHFKCWHYFIFSYLSNKLINADYLVHNGKMQQKRIIITRMNTTYRVTWYKFTFPLAW